MTLTYTFWSQLTYDQTYGSKVVTKSVLQKYFTSVRPGNNGWFGARVTMPEEKALAFANTVKLNVRDLVVETPTGTLQLVLIADASPAGQLAPAAA